jgi:hypothetical protein
MYCENVHRPSRWKLLRALVRVRLSWYGANCSGEQPLRISARPNRKLEVTRFEHKPQIVSKDAECRSGQLHTGSSAFTRAERDLSDSLQFKKWVALRLRPRHAQTRKQFLPQRRLLR